MVRNAETFASPFLQRSRIGFAMETTSTAHSREADASADAQRTTRHHHGTAAVNRLESASSRGQKALLSRLYGPILQSIAQVERRVVSELQSPYESVGEVLRHGTQLGGKRLRPALVLLAGEACGGINDDHLVLGTVIEMVHTATLVHDDVLDGAETRRHVPTINARWNNHTSILLGDYLFAQSFRLAATLSSTSACRQIGEASRLVCEGEMRQVLQRDALDVDEPTYFDMIRGKTAELCRVACELGAEHAGADLAHREAMGRYGMALGIAFQIADDYLDLWGNDDAVGKTLGTDVEQGKITLPIIRLLAMADPADRNRIARILRGPVADRVEAIRPFLLASDAKDYTRRTAERFRADALAAIDSIPNSPAKAALVAIADFTVDRRF